MKMKIKQGEMIITTTIRIEASSDSQSSTGTGFFYSISEHDKYIPMIITNRHVVQGMKKITIVFTLADQFNNSLNKHIRYSIDNVTSGIVFHPNKDIDLCAITLYDIINDIQSRGETIHTYYIDKTILANQELLNNLDAFEEIIMVGYPNGLWDKTNNKPIVRKGITATHPALNYNGKSEFLIDAACYPGSSGSPIFYLDKSYKTEVGASHTGFKIFLLGILYSGPINQLFIKNMETGSILPYCAEQMINLGNIIKAENLLGIELEVKKMVPNASMPK